MNTKLQSFNFCRVCLVPEESEVFSSIFKDNAKMAVKIYKIAGISIMDIDSKIPSLICGKCVEEIESVEKLKMRILDADEYYSMMTQQSEKEFLEIHLKGLINAKAHQNNKSSTKKKKVAPIESKLLNIKIKEEPMNDDYELAARQNSNPRKRKLETEYDEMTSPAQKPQNTIANFLIPKATPNSLGIHRMVISKSKKTIMKTESSLSFPIATKTSSKKKSKSKKKKKTFTPKINLSATSKPKSSSRPSTGGKQPKTITFECDNCKDTFGTYQALDEHMIAHDSEEAFACDECDATFANTEYLGIHKIARHYEDKNEDEGEDANDE
jgi:Zinc-finger associated domain (zf-AD)/C2H2-type zinc finger